MARRGWGDAPPCPPPKVPDRGPAAVALSASRAFSPGECLGAPTPAEVTPDFASGPADRKLHPRGPSPVTNSQLRLQTPTQTLSHAVPTSVGGLRTAPRGAAPTSTLSFLNPNPLPAVQRPTGPAASPPGWRPSPRAPVSTLPLTSGTSPALRAPRGGWNPGDLAVVAEAVEACLLSPWKPPEARSR